LTPLHAGCGKSIKTWKESAVKQALRKARWAIYALTPGLLVLGHVIILGKRW
jgi:hypothetical protein